MAERAALERANVRMALIQNLAGGVRSHRELAAEYDVSHQAITAFASRHAVRISEARRHFDDRFASIEYASKEARVEMLSDLIGDNVRILRDPAQMAKLSMSRAELTRAVVSTSREIGDLLGQIPTKLAVSTEAPMSVVINGVDLSDLR